MIARAAFVLAFMAASVASAAAQSITGDWLTSTDAKVRVSSSNGRYVGTFTSGPYSGERALNVTGTGNGRYKGQLFRYRGSTRPMNVRGALSSNQLLLDSCADYDDGYGCLNIARWQRARIQLPPHLSPAIKDEIRKPKPPPVIRKPGLHLKRTPG